jgi:hypothetical protein
MKTKIISLAALLLCVCALKTSATETVPQTQTVLKSYFQTGNVPTQNNYAELIDTMFWYVAATYTNSLAAQSNATVAISRNPVAASLQWTLHTSVPYVSISHTNGISSIGYKYSSGSWTMTNYFSTPMSDTTYQVNCINAASSLGITYMSVSAKFTNCCVFTVSVSGGAGEGYFSYFVFYQ